MKALVCRCHNGHLVIASVPEENLHRTVSILVGSKIMNPYCALCGDTEWKIELEEIEDLEAEEKRQQELRDSAIDPYDPNPIDLHDTRKKIFGG